MATSILTNGGIVAIGTSVYGTDDDPVGATTARKVVSHGLHHAADSYAQMRVNVMAIDSGATTDVANYYDTTNSTAAGTWYRVSGSPFGQWPMTLRADGTPYKTRVRLAGALNSATGNPIATFRVILAPVGSFGLAEVDNDGDHVFEATTATTAIGWLSGTSQGPAASATVLSVDAEQARSWQRSVGIYNAVSSAAPMTIEQVLITAHVFAKVTVATRVPRMHALMLQEYVGA